MALRGGTGLVVLLDPADDPISADVSALLAEAGIEPGVDAAAGPAVATTEETAEVTDLDLLARVNPAQLSVLGTIRTQPPAAALLRHGRPARQRRSPRCPTSAPAGWSCWPSGPARRASDELLFNAITYAAGHLRHRRAAIRSDSTADPAWLRLKESVTALQALQAEDGSVPEPADHAAASNLTGAIIGRRRRPLAPIPARRRLPGRAGQGPHPLGRRRFRRSRTSWTRWSPSTRRSAGSTAANTWSCSRCTPRTAARTAMWKPFWCR